MNHVGPLTGNMTEMVESVNTVTSLYEPAKGQLLKMLKPLHDHMISMEFTWENNYSKKSADDTVSALVRHDIHVIPTPPSG